MEEAQPDTFAPAVKDNVMEAPYAPPYKLPKSPPGLYAQQLDPLLSVRPSSVIFAAKKWQEQNPYGKEDPFERVLRKLPQNIRPSSQGPAPPGPMTHPSEPIWFEMGHRLHVILKRRGRRAERRKKRRMRSKMVRGR